MAAGGKVLAARNQLFAAAQRYCAPVPPSGEARVREALENAALAFADAQRADASPTGLPLCLACGQLKSEHRNGLAHPFVPPDEDGSGIRLRRTGAISDGKNVYRALDRFVVRWSPRQGARSVWTVKDEKTEKFLRADNLAEARETIVGMLKERA